MSLQTQIQSFVLRAAQEFNAVSTKIGSLASLSTTDKTSRNGHQRTEERGQCVHQHR